MVLHGVEVVGERCGGGHELLKEVVLHGVEVVGGCCDGGRKLLESPARGHVSGALPVRAPLPLAPPS